MKILKQLSKFFLFTFLLINPVSANEPVDIWNIEKKDTEENEILIENTNDDENKIIQGIKIEQQNEKILVNNALGASEIKLAGLYDPEENGLSIDMWSNSNGEDIKYVLDNITTKELSKFSETISFSSFKAFAPWETGVELLLENEKDVLEPIFEKSE